jgi:hypothetical protein
MSNTEPSLLLTTSRTVATRILRFIILLEQHAWTLVRVPTHLPAAMLRRSVHVVCSPGLLLRPSLRPTALYSEEVEVEVEERVERSGVVRDASWASHHGAEVWGGGRVWWQPRPVRCSAALWSVGCCGTRASLPPKTLLRLGCASACAQITRWGAR